MVNYERVAGAVRYREVRVTKHHVIRLERFEREKIQAKIDDQKRCEREKLLAAKRARKAKARLTIARKKLRKKERIAEIYAGRVERRRLHAAVLAGRRTAPTLPPLPY